MESEGSPIPLYAYLAVPIIICILKWQLDPLNAIPTVGGTSLPVLSYWTAWRFKNNPVEIITEGYRKYHGSVFKVALFHRWAVIASGSHLIDELRKWPNDDVLSMTYAFEDRVHCSVLLGNDPADDHDVVDMVRKKLQGKRLSTVLPSVVDELTVAIPQLIQAENDEWVSLLTLKLFQDIVARTTNRILVGVPLCRNERFLQVAINYSIALGGTKHMIDLYPDWLKWVLRPFYTHARKLIRDAMHDLKPLIDERKNNREAHGDDYDGKPNDMLQWIMDDGFATNISDWVTTRRLLGMEVASIHTTSATLSLAMYRLAASPEYVQALREEIEPIIAAEGWTKEAFGKMCKVDSFLRESQRCDFLGLASMGRMAMKDVTLSNGTFLPAGTIIYAATYPLYHDETVYSSPDTFDPFRFSRVCQADGSETCKQGYVSTSNDHIAFGHGKRACPGRFFAANELKAMLTYLLIHYDVRLPGDSGMPESVYSGLMLAPNLEGRIMFRKRQV